jgi:hypothetical protein
MRRSIFKGALVLVASGGLLAAGVGPALADGDHGEADETIGVVGNGSSVALSVDTVEAESISFEVSSTNPSTPDGGGGSEITLFRLNEGRTLDQFFGHLADEFSQTPATAAQGTRGLKADATFLGLADVVPGYPETVTETLTAGTYYLMDLTNGDSTGARPELTTLKVREGDGDEGDSDLDSDLTVTTSADRFHAPDVWPDEGTYTFSNKDDTPHMMIMAPVKEGTTDAQVQAAFDDPTLTGPPDFALNGPIGGNDVVSPGYSIQVTYDLPHGTYVLLCFVADEETGIPHAIMGMHKVVVLK